MSPAAAKERGNAALAANKLGLAISCFSLAIKLDPTDATYFSNRSLAYVKAGLACIGLPDALQCIALKPYWGRGYSRKASALLDLFLTLMPQSLGTVPGWGQTHRGRVGVQV